MTDLMPIIPYGKAYSQKTKAIGTLHVPQQGLNYNILKRNYVFGKAR